MMERRLDTSETAPALRSVFFRDTSTWVSPDFDPQIPGQALASQFKLENGFSPRYLEYEVQGTSIKTYTFLTRFDFHYSKNTNIPDETYVIPEAEICARIHAEIAVEYAVIGETMPSNEQLNHMAQTSVLTQAWPYWREFCHSTQTRMGLPITMIPLLVMRQEDQKSFKDADISSHKISPAKRRKK